MKGLTTAWYAILGLVAVVLVSFFAASFPETPHYKPELMASWVQAVGSVATIVGGLWGIHYQLERSERKRLESILAVAEAAIDRVELVGRLMSTSEPRNSLIRDFHQSMLDGVLTAFAGVPVHEVQSGKGVIALMALRDQLAFLGRAISLCIDGPDSNSSFQRTLQKTLEFEGADAWQEMRVRFERILNDNVMTHVEASRSQYAALISSVGR